MATIDIGKLAFTHKGDYNGSTAYVARDVVYYNGSAYIAKTSTTGNLPTSTTIPVGFATETNTNGESHIAYAFAEKQGYSRFGTYQGNGSSHGPFVYLGFKPAWLMYKRSSDTGNWRILDNKRNIHNIVDKELYADSSSAEAEDDQIDFLSNGFQLRNGSSVGQNGNNSTYIYMAFAESPFVSSEGVPTTAF